MDYTKGNIYELCNVSYELKDIAIFNEKNNRRFMLLLNVLAFFVLIVSYMIVGAINSTIHGINVGGTITITPWHLIYFGLFLLGCVVFIFLHEYLHGLGFRTDKDVSKKHIKYGFEKKIMCPYCECKKPIRVKNARLSLLLPVYVLVFPMFIVALIMNSHLLIFFASLALAGSTGDLYYIWKLRNSKKTDYMYEASNEKNGLLGYYLFKKVYVSNRH